MPLPDADKRSPRVYTLLQNQDLENVTADTLADVADPISIEEANEDELRRICLVAFARMVTKGSFDGWLSSGGSAPTFNAVLLEPNPTYDYALLAQSPPWGTVKDAVTWTISADYSYYFPFVSPVDGELTEVGLNVDVGVVNSLEVGFYDIGTDGLPGDLLGSCTIDVSSTGFITQSSFAGGAPTLAKGTAYWYAVVRTGTGSAYPQISAIDDDDCPGLGISTTATGNYSTVIDNTGTSNELPSSFAFAFGQGKPRPKIALQV